MQKPLLITSNAQKMALRMQRNSNHCFRILLLLIACCSFGLLQHVQAQTPGIFKTGTGTSGNTIPLNQTSQKTQLLYAPGDFNVTPRSGNITKIYFRNSAAASSATFTNFKVSFLQNTDALIPSTSFYTGLTVAHYSALQSVTANATAGGWFEIPLQAPYFQYDSTQTLIIEIQYTEKTGGISTTTSTSTGNKRVSGTSLTATTGTANTTWNDFGMDVLPVSACTAPPTAGTATSSATSLCANQAFTLNLTGINSGTGQTFQWETSANGSTGWTPVGTSSNSPIFTTSQSAGTHYYRAAVTCSGQTAYSTSIAITSPALVSGTFTIDGGQPASATNFQTFTDAINSLSCGIGGPVTFNVAAGTYNEQIVIPQVTGMSAANPVVFNGNGATLSGNPVTGTRAMILLDGADYVTISNLNIVTTGTGTADYGWGIHLTNEANNNTISNNNITIGSLSTTESNSVGIILGNSLTSVTTTGGNNGNNNIISGNTITGAYKGLHLHGVAANSGNNQIINNTIKDFHVTGIEINGLNGTLLEGNNFSRPTRTTVGTFYGIYLSGAAQNSVISKNRIQNTHGGATSVTGSAYGIYSTANDAPAGSENIAKNNVIYNFNGTGTVNAIYNSGSDGIYYYNNTILLDNMASTGIARGLYQSTLANNIKFINNNVMINTGGTATNQQAIYLNTATTTVESNRNNLYVPNGNIGYHNATQYTTLADWQTANSGIYDLNSVSADPFFTNVSTGDLKPTNSVLNNVAQALAAVTDDVTGAPRHASTPDIGAYEFTPSSLDIGVTALVTPATQSCYSNAEPVSVTVTNFGTAAVDFSTITANVAVTVTGAASPAPITVALTNAFNGGQPLAPAASMTVLLGTVNMTTAGTYTFNATSNVTAGGTDGNAANNAMTATDVIVAPLAAGTASANNTQLCQSGVTTLNLAGATGGNIQWQEGTSASGPFTNITGATGASFTLPVAITQTTYYQAVVSCGTNTATSNTVTVTVNITNSPTVAAVSRCGPGVVTLTTNAATGTTISWHDAATGGTSLATGTTYSPNVTTTTTFYATATDGGGTFNVGPTSNNIGATGGSATASYYQIFDVLSPLTLQHVYVYPAIAGNVNLNISDNTGTILRSVTVSVTTADVNQKTLIPINFYLPVGTGYRIGWASGGVSLLRNSTGATYPYTVPGIISVTGNSFSSGANYWYAVYDWNITTGCESAPTPVVVTVNPKPATPTITRGGPAGQELTSSAATGNQWLLNGQPISGATAQVYQTTANGTYAVVVTDANGCTSDTSTVVNITNTGIKGSFAGMSVSVYPNPSKGNFNVKLTGYKHEAAIELYSLTGQLIVKENVKAGKEVTSMQVKNLAAGTYMLKVVSEEGVQVSKLIVE